MLWLLDFLLYLEVFNLFFNSFLFFRQFVYDELFGIDVDGKSVFIELDMFVAHVYES